MDAQPSHSDDMSDLESRLSQWRPSTAGLDADGVLFAAGRASVRPGWGRFAWPVVSGCLALVATILAVGLSEERSAHMELAARLRDQKPPVVFAPSTTSEPYEAPATEPPAADSYLAARRALAGNPDSWLTAKAEPAVGPSPPNQPIWKAGSRADVLER